MRTDLKFKIASEKWEFEQINKLNYKTFVEEIPQHKENNDKSLLDKFHNENSYLICIRDKQVLGMMAVRDKRPFSLDHKLNDLDSYLPEHNFSCEFRLLSIEKEFRNLRIIQGLMVLLAQLADEKGYDIALISANVKRLRFYKQIGFKQFGPEVGSSDALYQPMYLTLESSNQFRKKSKLLSRLPSNFSMQNIDPINLLPGPVKINESVEKAMQRPPVSHRSEEFNQDFQILRRELCDLTGANNVEILMGSGSLANDAVAAQLAQLESNGLIISNGEFGERLINHAERAQLNYQTVELAWGQSFDYNKIEVLLRNNPDIKWLWFVHSETSTGVLNDLNELTQVCLSNDIKICVDCVSSLGILPFDLQDIYLASGVSGKGLASYSGLSLVFYNSKIASSITIPRYLDLGFYAENDGIPFTMSTNLVYALSESLKGINRDRFEKLKLLSLWIRDELDKLGFEIISNEDSSCPGLITIQLPQNVSSTYIGEKLYEKGYLLHYRSKYLVDRNWIQIAILSNYSEDQIKSLFKFLYESCQSLSKAQ